MKDRVEKAVREVLKEMGLADAAPRPQGPRVLVVYHTGLERLDEALAQVARIESLAEKTAFWQGPEAREMMCPADLKDRTGARCSLNTVNDEGLSRVLDRSEVVVLPCLSLKVAARVVRLTADCQGSDLVLTALLKGKQVIAANDCFLPPGAGIASGLRTEMKKTLAALAGYGAILRPTTELARTYESLGRQGQISAGRAVRAGDADLPRPPALSLVTARDITSASQAGENKVYLAPKGLSTPLARDLAKEYGLEIIRENN